MIRSLSRLALAPLVVLLPACNTPPKEAHDAAIVTAPPASSSASASASASAPSSASAPAPASASASAPAPAPAPASPPSAPGACTTDADCRLFSSYCQEAPCACRALGSRDPSPRCLGDAASNVRCFADPCMKKAAQCQSGACVVTGK